MRGVVALAVLAVGGCAAPHATPRAPQRDLLVGAGIVDAGEDAVDECHHDMPADELDATATAPFDAIDFQVDDLGDGLVITGPVLPGQAFSRVPPFTLLRDGTVVRHRYADDLQTQELVRGHLARAEADRFLRDIEELGFRRLLSNVSECACPVPSRAGMLQVCTSDARMHVLRARGSDGVLRHVAVYANHWNHPVIAANVRAASEHLAFEARPWEPETATLVLKQRWAEPTACRPSLLDASYAIPKDKLLWAAALRGASLRTVETALGSRVFHPACVGGNEVLVALYPWLPGMSFDDAIARWQARVRSGEIFY